MAAVSKKYRPRADLIISSSSHGGGSGGSGSGGSGSGSSVKRRKRLDPTSPYLLDLCSGANDAGPADCYRSLPESVGSDEQSSVEMCRGATGVGPALCVAHFLSVPTLRSALKSRDLAGVLRDLCGSAANDGPSRCYEKAKNKVRLDSNTALDLCVGAENHFPAECANALLSSTGKNRGKLSTRTIDIDAVVSVCRMATTTTTTLSATTTKDGKSEEGWMNPARCVWACPQQLPSAVVADLCRGAPSSGPGECASAGARIASLALDINVVRQQERKEKEKRKQRGDGRRLLQTTATLSSPVVLSLPPSLHRLARLCGGASSTGPVECYLVPMGSLGSEQKVSLCSGASNVAPARCVQAVRVRGMAAEAKVRLCRGATSIAPATCANTMPSSVGGQGAFNHEAGELSSSSTPTSTFSQHIGLAQLCSGASKYKPDGPSKCFLRATSVLTVPERIELCRGTLSESPAICANNVVSRDRDMSARQIVTLCKSNTNTNTIGSESNNKGTEKRKRKTKTSADVSPSDCIARAPKSWESSLRLSLCRNAVHSTDESLKCANDMSNHPSLLPDDALKLELCLTAKRPSFHKNWRKHRRRRERHPPSTSSSSGNSDHQHQQQRESITISPIVACLTAAAPQASRLTQQQTVEICKGATSVMPAKCARSAPSSLGGDQVVHLCSGARSLSPVHCAAHVLHSSVGGGFSGSQSKSSNIHKKMKRKRSVAECRGNQPIPTSLVITTAPTNITFDRTTHTLGSGRSLKLSSPVVAHVLDQYGQRMGGYGHVDNDDSWYRLPSQAVLVVDKGREMQSTLSGNTIIGPLGLDGRYVFQNVSMLATRAGVHWLKVTAENDSRDPDDDNDGDDDAGVRPALVPLAVRGEESPDLCWSQQGCDFLYHRLVTPRWSRSVVNDGDDGGFSGTVFNGALAGIFCAESLAAHGVEIYVTGASGNLLLRGTRYGLGRVKARVGVPHQMQTARERLGLDPVIKLRSENNTSPPSPDLTDGEKRTIKRAYRTSAREWHPDKWQVGTSNSGGEDNTTSSPSSNKDRANEFSGSVRGIRECQEKTRNYFELVIDAFDRLVGGDT